ncbi:MAG: hypothetical protein HYZ72_15360, partial [Deltaproteobacteria bacterium]|nr:hypothetical protein [Deltaproteobacteria bacterium]
MSRAVFLVPIAVLVASLFCGASAFALTPEEVLKLKAAGVSDETIQMMLQKELDDKVSSDTVEQGYATEHMGTWKLKDGRTIHSTGKRQLPLHYPTEYPPPPPYAPQIYPYVVLPPAGARRPFPPATRPDPPADS